MASDGRLTCFAWSSRARVCINIYTQYFFASPSRSRSICACGLFNRGHSDENATSTEAAVLKRREEEKVSGVVGRGMQISGHPSGGRRPQPVSHM
ncbi:unnamed protein product [Boreogadus saida]